MLSTLCPAQRRCWNAILWDAMISSRRIIRVHSPMRAKLTGTSGSPVRVLQQRADHRGPSVPSAHMQFGSPFLH